MKYNYKCIVSKNGAKRYYKNVANKWRRITNKLGQKSQRGKNVYRDGYQMNTETQALPYGSSPLREKSRTLPNMERQTNTRSKIGPDTQGLQRDLFGETSPQGGNRTF